jgi:molybdenum cofactor biosynthesis enzyme MoaA
LGKLSIKRLEFVLTEKCNSRCAHCQGAHSPESQGVIEIEDGLNYLEETTSVTELDSFMIFGGESMLYPERTITLFQRASKLGIPETELITNGFWGKDREKAMTLALRLKEAGVTEVLISVDSFHLPYIPLDGPRNAAKASLHAGISKVRWNVAVLESIDAENEYDVQTRQIVESLQPLGLEINFNRIWPRGQARENLKDFFPRQPLEGDCPDKEDTLITPDCISLDPNGWASICWNLAIGNAKEVPLSELLIDYNWEEHPIIKTLVQMGPMGLLDLPESEGFDFQAEKYIDKCNLCCDLRKFARKTHSLS